MAVENVELMHECYPKHLCMGKKMHSKTLAHGKVVQWARKKVVLTA